MKKKVITTVIAVMSIGCSAVYAGSMDESNVSSAAVGIESVAEESELSSLSPGDVVQIGSDGAMTHSLLVERREGRELYLAAHTLDVRERPLSSYRFDSVRFLRILGFRTDETGKADCFPPLYAGTSLIL